MSKERKNITKSNNLSIFEMLPKALYYLRFSHLDISLRVLKSRILSSLSPTMLNISFIAFIISNMQPLAVLTPRTFFFMKILFSLLKWKWQVQSY